MDNENGTNRSSRSRKTGVEQFYTPQEVANFCLDEVLKLVDIDNKFLEPAGGTGVFIEALLSKNVESKNIISFDIQPKHHLVKLTENSLDEIVDEKDLIVVGNPPFGRNNSLSVPFFNHFAPSAKMIAYILPKSWRKWSIQDKLNQDFWLVKDLDLNTSFQNENKVPIDERTKLRTVFQIWERRQIKRPLVLPTIENRGYIEKVLCTEADVSLTVFGHGCGKVKTDFIRQPNTTQMFLKIKNKKVLEALRSVDFSKFFKNTAYTEALSIKEIRFSLNEWFDKYEKIGVTK